jgi:hypothetical protein
MQPPRTLLLALVLAPLAAPLAGCYERVVNERPFPGMAATRSNAPTAPDYREAQADFYRSVEDRNKKPFDPIGDWFIKPIGSAAEGIGNAFSGGDDPAKPATNPARPVTSASDVSNPPARSSNTTPDTTPGK